MTHAFSLDGLNDTVAKIAAAARAVNRKPEAVTLVAVSKTHGPELIRPVIAAGQRVFGENRVQEAQGKWPELRREFEDLELHLIGPLQTNKVKEAMVLFDVIETIDRDKLAGAIAAERDKGTRCPKLFVQVNTGEEPQKAGIHPKAAVEFVARCRSLYSLEISGLMCIPPVNDDPALHFALLFHLAEACGVPGLSMGMSGDFEQAVRLGATHVRVGSAIFGSRG